MAAKWILPSFGGSASTWAACMLFFQALLLGGYGYVHHGSRLLPARAQLAAHLGLLTLVVAAVLRMPAAGAPQVVSGWAPAQIALLLLAHVGLPYFALACTAPLLQRWAALRIGGEPYALYAWSNVGSFAALLVYPWWIEPALRVSTQLRLWGWAVSAFAVLLGGLGLWLLGGLAEPLGAAGVVTRSAAPSPRVRLRWLAYSFVPSVLLLSITNQVTVDIAATPLLWVVPLALYLLSFVLAFGRFGQSLSPVFLPLWLVCALGLGYGSFAQGSAPLWLQLSSALGALFSACVLCNVELVRQRPAPEQLTRFYLDLAWGGVLGGVFVSLLAPVLWSDYYEVELATLATFALLLWAARSGGSVSLGARQRRLLYLGLGLCVPLTAAGLLVRAQGSTRTGSVVERTRSFLGPLRVIQFPVGRVLTHGRIRHGMQLTDPRLRRQPTMYFGPGTALATVLLQPSPGARRIGVVGLGVGTIAAYGRAGDTLQFYELDPDVLALAQRDFSFLRDSSAAVSVQIGDGRLLLARQPPQRFHVLVLDAFSSDSVPVHLLTREAFAVYLQHLAPRGLLLANVSNRHLAVERVVRASAKAHGLACSVVQTEADAEHFVSRVRWAVMAREPAQLRTVLAEGPQLSAAGQDVLWTDEHASLWSILR
jgi:hypothetical protein